MGTNQKPALGQVLNNSCVPPVQKVVEQEMGNTVAWDKLMDALGLSISTIENVQIASLW